VWVLDQIQTSDYGTLDIAVLFGSSAYEAWQQAGVVRLGVSFANAGLRSRSSQSEDGDVSTSDSDQAFSPASAAAALTAPGAASLCDWTLALSPNAQVTGEDANGNVLETQTLTVAFGLESFAPFPKGGGSGPDARALRPDAVKVVIAKPVVFSFYDTCVQSDGTRGSGSCSFEAGLLGVVYSGTGSCSTPLLFGLWPPICECRPDTATPLSASAN
jgi:hypothetical protein